MLDADAHAVLCEDDVLLGHAVARRLFDLVGGQVDLVAHKGGAAEEDEQEDEGEYLAVFLDACPRLAYFRARRELLGGEKDNDGRQ